MEASLIDKLGFVAAFVILFAPVVFLALYVAYETIVVAVRAGKARRAHLDYPFPEESYSEGESESPVSTTSPSSADEIDRAA